jgi:hypothetical protein
MYILTLLEFIFLFIFILWFIWHYSNDEVTLVVKIVVFCDLFIIFGMFILLPLDIFIKIRMETLQIHKNDDKAYIKLQKVYYIYYWSVTVLCWLIIPLV